MRAPRLGERSTSRSSARIFSASRIGVDETPRGGGERADRRLLSRLELAVDNQRSDVIGDDVGQRAPGDRGILTVESMRATQWVRRPLSPAGSGGGLTPGDLRDGFAGAPGVIESERAGPGHVAFADRRQYIRVLFSTIPSTAHGTEASRGDRRLPFWSAFRVSPTASNCRRDAPARHAPSGWRENSCAGRRDRTPYASAAGDLRVRSARPD